MVIPKSVHSKEVILQQSVASSVIPKSEVISRHSETNSAIIKSGVISRHSGASSTIIKSGVISRHFGTGSKVHSVMPQSRMCGQATHVPDTPNGNGREDRLDSIKAEVEKLNHQYNDLFSVIRKMQINRWEALINSRLLEDGE